MTHNPDDRTPLDEAVSRRLSKLATIPVDTSRLDAAIRSAIPRRPERAAIFARVFRPLTAVAASIALIGAIALILLVSSSGGEALASPAEMAQVHRDIVENRTPVMRVSSIEQASKALSDSWEGSPSLPAPPAEHVMACCMKSIGNKHVACVLLQDEAGTPITMSVARGADMKLPKGPTVELDGVTYHVQAVGKLNMVSAERDERWICLIGEVSQEKLIALAGRLHF